MAPLSLAVRANDYKDIGQMDDEAPPLTAAKCDSLAAEYRARAKTAIDPDVRTSLRNLADTFAALARTKERLERGHAGKLRGK